MDTIVAPATPAGCGRRAVVRLSGPRAVQLAVAVLAADGEPARGHMAEAWVQLADGAPLPVSWCVFRGPRSVTGEDVVELHLPGWPVVVTSVVRRLVGAGARPAARGEFTRRALIHGRVDLDGALAVGQLAGSADRHVVAEAAAVLGGELARRAAALEQALLDLLALVEAHVDFDEEDTESIALEDLRAGISRCAARIRDVLRAGAARAPRDGETDVVLLGPPNAGKSTLFAALCPGVPVTVSPEPGTTRDALAAHVDRGGRRWCVWDGPGVGPLDDDLDRAAAARFLERLPPAAVVLHCTPGDGLDEDPAVAARRRAGAGDRSALEVLTKADLLPEPEPAAAASEADRRVAVCAPRGTGLDALWAALERVAPAPSAPDLPTRAEHAAAADLAPLLGEVEALSPLEPALPLLAEHLRDALRRLWRDRESPPSLTEAVLDRIFAGFCIGK